MVSTDSTGTVSSHTYTYDEQTQRVVGSSVDGEETTYLWEGELLVREVTPRYSYEYSYQADRVILSSPGISNFIYHLDANGYTTAIEMDSEDDGSYEILMRLHYENCRLVSRTLDEGRPEMLELATGFEQTMEYDEEGNLIARRDSDDPTRGERFDYSCWN